MMKRNKSVIAILLAATLCLTLICPAMGAETSSEALTNSAAAEEPDSQEESSVDNSSESNGDNAVTAIDAVEESVEKEDEVESNEVISGLGAGLEDSKASESNEESTHEISTVFEEEEQLEGNLEEASCTNVAQAIWTADNKTLTFFYGQELSVGDTFNGMTVTRIWSGTEVTNTGERQPDWNSSLKTVLEKVLFDESFKAIKPTSTYYWFSECSKLTSIDLTGLDTSAVTNMNFMFFKCSSLRDLDLNSFDTSSAVDMSGMFDGCSGLENLDVSGFDTSSATDMGCMFYGCSALESLDLSSFDTSCVTSMFSMFYECLNLTSLNVSSFNTSNVTDMSCMFYRCEKLKQIDVKSFDTSNVIDMQKMFNNCTTLTSLDVSGFDTSNVTDMWLMFCGCTNLEELDVSGFDTSNVYRMEYFFAGCTKLEYIDVRNFDTSNVPSMDYMFCDCQSLINLDLSSFNTSNVTSMKRMFCNCYSLSSLDLSSFDTSKVINMDDMFRGCKKLLYLDVRSFDTASVKTMAYMFEECTSLTSLDVSGFNTASVYNMENMFSRCKALTRLDVSNFDTSNVERMDSMFSSCDNLTVLDISGFDTTKVKKTFGMFASDGKLQTIYCTDSSSAFNDSKNVWGAQMFEDCEALVGKSGGTEIPYDSSKIGISMARAASLGGYFTPKDTAISAALFDELDIQTLIPSNKAVDVDHSVNLQIVFSKPIRLSGNGHINLYESDSDKPVETIDAVAGQHAMIVEPTSSEDTLSTLSLFFNTALKPDTTYSIAIDSNSLIYIEWDSTSKQYVETANKHVGIKKGIWSFTTAPIDYMHFVNQTDEIPEELYYYLFKPGKAFMYLHALDGARGKNGTCYGWAYAVGAKRQNYNGINSFNGKLCDLRKNSLSHYNNRNLLTYIQLAYLYQYSEAKLKEDKQNEDKYDNLYQAIKKQINGNGEDIIIAVYEGKKGHALYPVKIISENSTEIQVQVLDCNRPNNTYFSTLKLKKDSDKINGFEYKEYNDHISFDTIDGVLDNAFVNSSSIKDDSTLLVHSTSAINNSDLNEIIPKGNSDSESNLYWTEQSSISQIVPENTTIKMTDGEALIETTVEDSSEIGIDVVSKTAKVEPVDGTPVSYSLSYVTYNNEGNDCKITIESKTENGVETTQNEEGIIISTDESNHVVVSTENNTVEFTPNNSSVLIKTDSDISVYEDSNNDGSYTDAIEVTQNGVIKLSDTNTSIRFADDLIYRGKEIASVEAVLCNNVKLQEGKDYTVSYANNIEAGNATVAIIGIGAYTGTIEKNFEIIPKQITPTITLSKASFIYNQKEQKPAVTVKDVESVLTEDDYDITWQSGCTDIGTYSVTVTLKGNYSGAASTSFEIKSPWQKSDGVTYYYDENEKKVTGLQTIDNKKYYFNNDGVMQTGWQTIAGEKYYFDNDGAAHIGLLQYGDKWYYFRLTGVMHTGTLKKDGKYYYFRKDGTRLSGWLKVSGKTYYHKLNGERLFGWLKKNGNMFYFKTNGEMHTGWLKQSGKMYYFKTSGQMHKGWLKLRGKYYYFKTNGQMVTGRYKIGNRWYTFNKNGVRQ